MLPIFADIPETAPELRPDRKPIEAPRYYLRVFHKGEWYFLWKTHSNGGCEWELEATAGRKRPLWYKTLHGAKRQLFEYTYRMKPEKQEIALWTGNFPS